MKTTPLLNLVLAAVLALAVVAMLHFARGVLLPIVTAVILVYLMTAATEQLRRLPALSRVPHGGLSFLVVLVFSLVVVAFAVIVASTVGEILAVAPVYEQNLDRFVVSLADRWALDANDIWKELRQATIDRLDLRVLFLSVLGSFTSIGGTVFLILIYAAFLTRERIGFAAKMAVALRSGADAERVLAVVSEINARVTTYLAVKTLINVLLATLSLGILWVMGVDFALFWAIVIGMLNYIPYFGSYLGVAFPVVLSFAQFGSLPAAAWLALLLSAAQFVVGNVVEPRLIGRQLNLSPFVVLVALAVWTALWGVPGAILAIPMTSILTIVLAQFEATRFLAVLMAERTGAADLAR